MLCLIHHRKLEWQKYNSHIINKMRYTSVLRLFTGSLLPENRTEDDGRVTALVLQTS